ncbi:MAG TPA: 4a-hydroxytetrahydrobiopterin dehydratase [Aggregatilineales bacterium]|nr:4a-hydroxytetrahydrobiopterin dehydratase [Aggregatilineales bacterium]HPV07863.1 4a-hydroxytetrahydrobiopterin dehydratase [Aggregatilineales bacterium]HQA67955.1 4a-hydroxytetrahydrobiopterin dehydratase [Aggregatilineales bacterium]HQE17912.1 4a-hydroxytetrahydrobiopterin dehydratase [Aggregatilineales bacterium]
MGKSLKDKSLKDMKIVPVADGEQPATLAEVLEYHKQVPGWRLTSRGGILRVERTYEFKDFREALAFTNKVGELAEKVGHHPSIVTEWGRVEVEWWTHAVGGLHINDFIMAARTDELYENNAS